MMREKFPTILVAALLLAPTACSAGADPEPTVTETVTAPPASPASTETTEPAAEPTESQPAETAEPSDPAEPTQGETEVASEAPGENPGGGEVLSFSGVGEFNLGDTDMVAREAMVLEPECNVYVSAPSFAERGIYFEHEPGEADEDAPLFDVTIRQPEDGGEPVRTEAGVMPGMTYGEIKEIYLDAVEETKQGDGGPFLTLSVRGGDNELVFLREDYSEAAIEDGQTVEAIALRPYGEEMRGSC